MTPDGETAATMAMKQQQVRVPINCDSYIYILNLGVLKLNKKDKIELNA